MLHNTLAVWSRVLKVVVGVDNVPLSEKLGDVCAVPFLVPKFVGVGDGEAQLQYSVCARTHTVKWELFVIKIFISYCCINMKITFIKFSHCQYLTLHTFVVGSLSILQKPFTKKFSSH